MLMILSLSVVYAAPSGLWSLSDYGPCRTMAFFPDHGPLPDYGPCRTMASTGLWPLSDYGLHRDKAKPSPCK